ncbi:lecithin retinol acyltransferase family protein [Paraburkholderia azotifigens]|uniref:lecithin retinol acyltransferase family protein n=1 Tax=Paraburkholderia azotifigens TaxID=2057004 RepID=UPI003B8A89DF
MHRDIRAVPNDGSEHGAFLPSLNTGGKLRSADRWWRWHTLCPGLVRKAAQCGGDHERFNEDEAPGRRDPYRRGSDNRHPSRNRSIWVHASWSLRGGGKVVHYAGLSRSLRCGPVQEVSLAAFAHGHPVWIRQSPDARFAGLKAIRRAYSRLGEDRYRLVSNNCEHFCTWCLYGESRSDQINAWKFWITDHLMAAVVNTVRQLAITSWSICS